MYTSFSTSFFVTVLISSSWTTIYCLEMRNHSKSLLFINVQSLRSHHDEFCCQLEALETKPAVIVVCETWLTDNDPIVMYLITGHQPMIVKNRNDKRGGGVGFFVRDDCKLIANFFFWRKSGAPISNHRKRKKANKFLCSK